MNPLPVIMRFPLPNGDVIISLRRDVLERAIAAANAGLKKQQDEAR